MRKELGNISKHEGSAGVDIRKENTREKKNFVGNDRTREHERNLDRIRKTRGHVSVGSWKEKANDSPVALAQEHERKSGLMVSQNEGPREGD